MKVFVLLMTILNPNYTPEHSIIASVFFSKSACNNYIKAIKYDLLDETSDRSQLLKVYTKQENPKITYSCIKRTVK